MVARIADLEVTEAHVRNAFMEAYHRTGQVLGPDPDTRRAVLDAEFDTYVMAVHARDLGLADTDQARRRREAIRRRVLTEEVRDRILVADVQVTEQDLREYFMRFNTRLRASHLYAPDEAGIRDLQRRLNEGESFEALARDAFANERLAAGGGDLGWFTTDEMDVAFEQAAFNLRPEEVSGPVRTAQGYSLIKVTDRSTVPLLTEDDFQRQRDRLSSYVRKKKEELAEREHLEAFLTAAVLDAEAVSQAWSVVSGRLSDLHRLDPEVVGALGGEGSALLTHGDWAFTREALVEELLASLPGHVNSIGDREGFERFVKGAAYRSHLMDLAARAGLPERPEIIESIHETWMHHLESLAMEQLRRQAEEAITPADLYAEFMKDPSLYHEPVQLDLQRVVLADRETAERVREMALAGHEFTQLVRTWSRNAEDVLLDGRMGMASVRAYGFNGPALAALPVGGISEVIAYHASEFHVYKSLGLIDDRALSFQEAKDQVNDIVIGKRVRDLRRETLDRVKRRHGAFIDQERLMSLEIQI